jgi:rare lipoprotein A (peptidoglycan hydrolase)
VHLYANAGRGFETPTLNELAYRPDGSTGLNFALQPATSDNLEAGVKTMLAGLGELTAAVFETRTHDEIVTYNNTGGRSTYQNVGATRRRGIELGWSQTWLESLRAQVAWSTLDATYRNAFESCNLSPCPLSSQQLVQAGNRMPGVARDSLYGALGWSPPQGWRGGADVLAGLPDDADRRRPAPATSRACRPATRSATAPRPSRRPTSRPCPTPCRRSSPIRNGGPNKPYEIAGHTYVPLTDDRALTEKGLASWYGKKFHGHRTASGEAYNMYAMTAAHKTLPIPSYARVRNPANGKEVIVRVNDRGPFSPGRVIDLSYTAALKLGVLNGVRRWRSRASPTTTSAPAPRSASPDDGGGRQAHRRGRRRSRSPGSTTRAKPVAVPTAIIGRDAAAADVGDVVAAAADPATAASMAAR